MSEERDRDRRRNRSPRSRSRSPRRRHDSYSPQRSSGGHSKMVYISNIPYDVRWMELKDLIREKAGDGVAFVEMLDGQDGKPKGCAVVEFKDRDMATKCVEVMHRMPLKDRNLVVKEIREPERFFRKVKEETGVDFLANRSGMQSLMGIGANGGGGGGGGGGSHQSAARMNYDTYGLSPTFLKQLGIEGPLCSRVFAANLPYHVGPAKLKEVFGLAGNVTDVDLQMDSTGKNKGLAVIEYTHPIEAVQAISMLHNQKFHDRSITVKMDKFDKPQDMRRPGELPTGLKAVGMGLGANGTPLTNVAQLLGAATGTNGTTLSQGTSPFGGAIGNLGGQFSSSLFPSASNVTGSVLPSSGLSGFGSPNLAGSTGGVGGSNLYSGAGLSGLLSSNTAVGGAGNLGGHLSVSNPWTSGGSGGLSGFGGTGLASALDGGGGSGAFRGSSASALLTGSYERMRDYDRSVSPASHGGRHIPRSIVIRNLPLDYSWQTLRDRLRGFGEVEYADIVSPGVGCVRFKTSVDAEKALFNLTGIVVEGRPITVELAASD